MNENTEKNITPPVKSKNKNNNPKAPVKKKKKKSFKSLMRSITKSSMTEEERIQKQKDKINKSLVNVQFKKVDVI